MRLKLSHLLALAIAFFVATSLTQAQDLTEDEVPISVQKWFYNKYPGTDLVSWKETKSESGEKLFQANFDLKESSFTAIFNPAGKLVYENMEFKKGSSPAPLLDHATSNFGKFKLVAVHKHTNFDYGATHSKNTNYELVVKIGKELVTVWFNESMNRHDSFETSTLAIK